MITSGGSVRAAPLCAPFVFVMPRDAQVRERCELASRVCNASGEAMTTLPCKAAALACKAGALACKAVALACKVAALACKAARLVCEAANLACEAGAP